MKATVHPGEQPGPTEKTKKTEKTERRIPAIMKYEKPTVELIPLSQLDLLTSSYDYAVSGFGDEIDASKFSL